MVNRPPISNYGHSTNCFSTQRCLRQVHYSTWVDHERFLCKYQGGILAFLIVNHRLQISRKTYTQAFHFQTTIKGCSLTFKSDLDTTGLAHNPTYGRTDFFMTDHSASYDVVVSSYFDIGSAKLNAKAIRNPQYASTKFDLQTV